MTTLGWICRSVDITTCVVCYENGRLLACSVQFVLLNGNAFTISIMA